MNWADKLLPFAVIAAAANATLLFRSHPERWAHAKAVYRALRWRHLAAGLAGVALTAGVATALMQVGPLTFGWVKLVRMAAGIEGGTVPHVPLSPVRVLAGIACVVGFLPWLPRLAQREEVVFRKGAEAWTWPQRARRSITFGLAHLMNGFPIALCLALSVGGMWFTLAYLWRFRRCAAEGMGVDVATEHAVAESTRTHVMWNVLAVTMMGLWLSGLVQ